VHTHLRRQHTQTHARCQLLCQPTHQLSQRLRRRRRLGMFTHSCIQSLIHFIDSLIACACIIRINGGVHDICSLCNGRLPGCKCLENTRPEGNTQPKRKACFEPHPANDPAISSYNQTGTKAGYDAELMPAHRMLAGSVLVQDTAEERAQMERALALSSSEAAHTATPSRCVYPSMHHCAFIHRLCLFHFCICAFPVYMQLIIVIIIIIAMRITRSGYI
jgi:hypothetical protein